MIKKIARADAVPALFQASIAILNATLNIAAAGVTLGDELENVKSFSNGLDPRTTGEIVTNSDKIRQGKSDQIFGLNSSRTS